MIARHVGLIVVPVWSWGGLHAAERMRKRERRGE